MTSRASVRRQVTHEERITQLPLLSGMRRCRVQSSGAEDALGGWLGVVRFTGACRAGLGLRRSPQGDAVGLGWRRETVRSNTS